MQELAGIYRDGIGSIVAELFSTMLATEVAPLFSREAHSTNSQLTALVAFDGSWRGVLEFECGATEAIHFARRFLQMDELQECNEDVRDTLGELTNIVAGNLKAVMPGQITLCTPSVVEGRDYSVRICGGSMIGESWFKTEVGTFAVRLIEDTLAIRVKK